MYEELNRLLSSQVDYLHDNIDIFNKILIDVSDLNNKDQNSKKYHIERIIQNIEKSQDEFNKNIKEIQNNIKNFIKIFKEKTANASLNTYSSTKYTANNQGNKMIIQNYAPILGIDLGTSNSTVGYYRLNSRKRGEMDIVADIEGSRSVQSVVCIIDKKVYVGKEAVKMSSKKPKNFIYDSKRMLGRKYDDAIIQEYKKNWTFDITRSETGGILIKVDNEYYKPYEISGMILIELMNLANTHLNDQTNQAIITIPAYFTKEQIEDTKKAAKYANIDLIELQKEPVAATLYYGYKTNDAISSKKSRDILIYDFGGGTLDVSYVEVKGSNFEVLATDGDSELGGQDFTNSIFDIVSPKLNELCKPGWKDNSRFLNKVMKSCENAKIRLSSVNEYEIYLDIPKDIAKVPDGEFEYLITRKEFETNTKKLFDRCMSPVENVLKQVNRKNGIENLVLVGGSSYLPMILEKLYKLTHKNAYHGVSAVDAVAYGACVFAGKYIQQQLVKTNQINNQMDSKDLYMFSMNVVNKNADVSKNTKAKTTTFNGVTSQFGIIKYNGNDYYYETVINAGYPFPYYKDVLVNNTEVRYNKKEVIIPVFIRENDEYRIIHNIQYKLSSRDNMSQKAALLKILLCQNENGLFFSVKRPRDEQYPELYPIKYSTFDDSIKKKKENGNQDTVFESKKEIKQKQVNECTTIPVNLYIEKYYNNKICPQIVFNANAQFSKKTVNFKYNDVKINNNSINIPIYLEKDGEKRNLPEIIYQLPIEKNSYNQYMKYFPISIIFVWDVKCLQYATKNSTSSCYSEYTTLFENKALFEADNQYENVNENENMQDNNYNNQNEKQMINQGPSFGIKDILNEQQRQQQQQISREENKTLYQIEIFRIGKNENVPLAKIDKGLDFPQKRYFSLTGRDLGISSEKTKVFIPLLLVRDSIKQFELPRIEYELTKNDKTKSKNENFVDIDVEWNKNSFSYRYRNSEKQIYNKIQLTSTQIEKINKFCCC